MEKNIIVPNDLLPDTVFVPPILDYEPHKVFNVMQKNEYGKHELVGKIYHEKGKYVARNGGGKQIFKDTMQLSIIKNRFKEQVVQQELRRHELDDIRERKSKSNDKNIQR